MGPPTLAQRVWCCLLAGLKSPLTGAAILSTPVSAVRVVTRVLLSVVVPSPSCPARLSPQDFSLFSAM